MRKDIRKNYREFLQDPEWKEYSLSLISGESCWNCGSEENLEVHHLTYRKILPWEYDRSEVRVLCRDCHKAVHTVADEIWVNLLRFEPHELELFNKLLKDYEQDIALGVRSFRNKFYIHHH